jgi:hypothetical protein
LQRQLAGPEVEYNVDEVMEKINVGPKGDVARAKCREMLRTRLSLFKSKLAYTQTPAIHIETPRVDSGEVDAPAAPNRPMHPEHEKITSEKTESLWKQGIVEPANRSPYNAQMIPIRKPDGTIRPATDYRYLNAVVTKDTFPLPNIDANLNALGRANFYTTLDLLQGFLQCELHVSSRHKTAFTAGGRQWQYTRLPMGLTTSPSAFMRVVDAALQGLPPGIAFAYV